MAKPLRPFVRGGGYYPSKKWIPLVRNGGYTTQNGGDNVNWAKVSGVSPLSLPNALAHFINSLRQIGKCTVSGTDITCNNGVLKYGATGKNLLQNTATAQTISGVTFTVNSDGTVLVNGTATETISFNINLSVAIDSSKTYILSGCPSGGAGTTFSLQGRSGAPYDTGDGSNPFSTISGDGIRIRIASGVVCNNLVFKPMIRLASITDPTFEPYTEGFYTEGTPEEIRVTGVNQWDEEWEAGSIDSTNGENESSGNHWRSKNYIPVFPGLTYYFASQTATNAPLRLRYYGKNKEYLGYQPAYSTGSSGTIPDNCYYIRFAPQNTGVPNHDISINYPATVTDYTPFYQETATASNLFAVGSVTDEQDIISGTVTRRCEAVVSDGTTPSGRYIGTVGEGNILVCAKETGYSGAIASFETEESKPLSGLVAEISPVQDLHGYDAPWPDGGWKNLFDASTFQTVTINGVTCVNNGDGSFTINGTATGTDDIFFNIFTKQFSTDVGGTPLPSAEYRLTGFPSGAGSSGFYMYTTPSYGGDRGDGQTFTNTITGGSIYIKNGTTVNNVTIWPMIRLADNGDDTFAPYANECPISGWTGVQGQRTGANVLNPSLYSFQTTTMNGLTYTVQQDGTVKVTGTATATGGPSFTSNFKLKPGTYRWLEEAGQGVVCAYRKYPAGSSSSTSLSNPFTTDGTDNIYLNMYCSAVGTYDLVVHPQISVGSDVVGFTPYTGEPISVTFPSTIYGGTDEVVSGNGVITMGMVDLGDLTWYLIPQGHNVFYAPLVGTRNDTGQGNIPNIVCSQYSTTTAKSNTDWSISTEDFVCSLGYDSARVYVRDSRYSSEADFKTAMSGVQLCYELATPTTFTHEGQSVDTLVGQNNVWVDTGNVTAYVPDFTTEKVAGQSLSTTEGTNTVFVTSNVDPVSIEVEYAVAPEE